MKKIDGAIELAKRMAYDEIPNLARQLEDPLISKTGKLEAQNVDTSTDLVRHLETLPQEQRRETTKNLKKRVHV